MFFPGSHPDALDQIRAWQGDIVTRRLVECALDFMIMLEPELHQDYGKAMREAMNRFPNEYDKAELILHEFGLQIRPETVEAMQEQFYSFSNSFKYRYSAETISVVRSALNKAFDGINGWLN